MKIAIVHDDLIQFGGSERLLLSLFELWPNATLFTSYASDAWLLELKEKNIKLRTSFMQKLPFKKRLNKYYGGLLFYPLAFESFDFSDFDLVLSVSSRFSHCVITKPGTVHVSYINSPGRMFWEFWDYYENYSFSTKNFIKNAYLYYLKAISTYYRMWDYYASFRPNYLLANAKVSQARIKKYYGKDSTIIYPFVDTAVYEQNKKTKDNFYLVISRLTSWKRVDIAVEAFIKNGKNLIVIGDGPELESLKQSAASFKNIEFLGRVEEDQKIALLCSCNALINTQLEDFGIVPLEAMAAGKPVLAYGKGGVLETVVPGKTGMFFDEQTPQSLNATLEKFEQVSFLMTDCIYQARKFDKELFFQKIKNFVDSVYLER